MKSRQKAVFQSIALLVAFVLSMVILEGCVQGNTKQEIKQNIEIYYYFTAEFSYQKIEINQSTLKYTYFDTQSEDVKKRCDFWVAQAPCWREEDLRTKEATLSETEVNDLIRLVREIDFMNLKDVYGGATEGQRYYSYGLSVSVGEDVKNVVYQSFPGASAPPKAFTLLENALFELVKIKFQSEA